MPLPDFPINRRLIPYDDLGIQEVSPNRLSLRNDVDIVLAALMAMGKHGSQMLQADDNQRLIVNSSKLLNYKNGGSHVNFGVLHVTDALPNIEHLDLSDYFGVTFVMSVSNYDDINTNIVTVISCYNSNGDITGLNRLFSFSDNGVYAANSNMVANNVMFTNDMAIQFFNLNAGKSFDVNLEIYGI